MTTEMKIQTTTSTPCAGVSLEPSHDLARLEVLFLESRERFESWAGLNAPELPPILVDAMQVKLLRWEIRNFGTPSNQEHTLGVVEEVGETFEAKDEDAAIDGIGDVEVYIGQLLAANRLAIGPALVAANEAVQRGGSDALGAAGHLCHVILKRTQKIRGMDHDGTFRRALFSAAVDVLAGAHDLAASRFGTAAVDRAAGLVGIYLKVGEKVSARDWKADPKKGGE